MIDLLILMHAAREATHYMHWFAAGSQHTELAAIYEQFDNYFDTIAEVMIQAGDEKELNLLDLLYASREKLNAVPGAEAKNQTEFFAHLVTRVDEILEKIEAIGKLPLSFGEMDMLGSIGHELEILKYKSIKLAKFE
jgi:DNA-binding ferritin-like protein